MDYSKLIIIISSGIVAYFASLNGKFNGIKRNLAPYSEPNIKREQSIRAAYQSAVHAFSLVACIILTESYYLQLRLSFNNITKKLKCLKSVTNDYILGIISYIKRT